MDDTIDSLLARQDSVKLGILQMQKVIKEKDEEIQKLKKQVRELEEKCKKDMDDEQHISSGPKRRKIESNSTSKDVPAFDKLFSKSVPHILEKIFLSLDYKSYKACLEVNTSWKELLASESYQKKGKSWFKTDISRDEDQLWHQASFGKIEEVRRLLSSGMLNVNCSGSSTRNMTTPLLEAADRGHKEVVTILLEKGAKPNKVHQSGKTPLLVAVDRGHNEVVKLLLDAGADLENDTYRHTPLSCASLYGHKVIAKILLEKGAKADNPSRNGSTPLYEALYSKNLEIVQLLLKYGADPNRAGFRGFPPLHVAVDHDLKDVIKILLDKGADPNKAWREGGQTALHYAAFDGNMDVFQLLLDRGADPNKEDNKGITPLTLARR